MNYIILITLPESYWVNTIYKIYKIVYKSGKPKTPQIKLARTIRCINLY